MSLRSPRVQALGSDYIICNIHDDRPLRRVGRALPSLIRQILQLRDFPSIAVTSNGADPIPSFDISLVCISSLPVFCCGCCANLAPQSVHALSGIQNCECLPRLGSRAGPIR